MSRAGFGLVFVLVVGCDSSRVETLERRVEALEKKDTEQAATIATIGNPTEAIAKLQAELATTKANELAKDENLAKLQLQIADLEAKSQSLEEQLAKLGGTVATKTASGGFEKIGIPECDEYLEKYSRCIADKMPEATREGMQDAMQSMAKAWRDAADGPAKPGLATACKAALEAAAEATKAMGCEW